MIHCLFLQEISKSILALYELWKAFDEKKEMVQILAKMPKPKLQPMQQQGQQGHSQMQQNN
jgi:cyclin C